MRKVNLLAAMTAVIFLAAGCSARPKTQLRLATEGYASTLEILSQAREAGKIDDATALKVETARRVTAALLDNLKARIESGGNVLPSSWDDLYKSLATLYEIRDAVTKEQHVRGTFGGAGRDEGGGGISRAVDADFERREPRADSGRNGASSGASGLGRVALATPLAEELGTGAVLPVVRAQQLLASAQFNGTMDFIGSGSPPPESVEVQ